MNPILTNALLEPTSDGIGKTKPNIELEDIREPLPTTVGHKEKPVELKRSRKGELLPLQKNTFKNEQLSIHNQLPPSSRCPKSSNPNRRRARQRIHRRAQQNNATPFSKSMATPFSRTSALAAFRKSNRRDRVAKTKSLPSKSFRNRVRLATIWIVSCRARSTSSRD